MINNPVEGILIHFNPFNYLINIYWAPIIKECYITPEIIYRIAVKMYAYFKVFDIYLQNSPADILVYWYVFVYVFM